MIKLTMESTEGTHRRIFSVEFEDGTTWVSILEMGLLPGFRALTFEGIDTDKVMNAIDKALK